MFKTFCVCLKYFNKKHKIIMKFLYEKDILFIDHGVYIHIVDNINNKVTLLSLQCTYNAPCLK